MILKFFRFIIMSLGLLTLGLIAVSYYHVRHTLPSPKAVAEKTILEIDFTKDFNEDYVNSGFVHGIGRSSFSLHDITKMIRQAAEDHRILGLIVNLGCLDLGMAQIQELRNAIKDFKNHGKYAHVQAARIPDTKLYYLSSVFDHITVQPGGEIGFIGFTIESPFFRDFFNKYGIIPSFEKQGRYKSAPETFLENDFSTDHKEQILHILNNFHDQVVTAISQERKLSLEKVQQLITKGPYSSTEAKAESLIDTVGFYEDAKNYIMGKAGKEAVILHQWEYTYDPLNFKKGVLPLSLNKKPAKIAVVYALGTIKEGDEKSWDSKSIYWRAFHKIFSHITKDPTIRAVVLRIDSGGGSATASEAIAYEIQCLQQKGIPVIVSMGNYAASGGYLIAAGADHIFAQPGTITGSIGCYTGKFVTNPAWDQQGIHWRLLKTADNADIWHSNAEFDGFGKERIKALNAYTYKLFTEAVAKGRKLSLEQVEHIAQGKIWTGQHALEHKLVDSLGGLNEAIQYAKELITDVPSYSIAIETFPKPRMMIEHFLQMAGFIEDEEISGFGFDLKTELKKSFKEIVQEFLYFQSFVQF